MIFAVFLGLACQRFLVQGSWIAKLLGRAARCARADEASRFTFGGRLVRSAHFGEETRFDRGVPQGFCHTSG